jgi:hypothetical protein
MAANYSLNFRKAQSFWDYRLCKASTVPNLTWPVSAFALNFWGVVVPEYFALQSAVRFAHIPIFCGLPDVMGCPDILRTCLCDGGICLGCFGSGNQGGSIDSHTLGSCHFLCGLVDALSTNCRLLRDVLGA